MDLFGRKARAAEQTEAEQRGDAMDRYLAEGDAAVDESENERKARAANQPPPSTS